MSWVWDDEYDWLAWLRCKIGIHTPRVYWHSYAKGKKNLMFYWKCLHCKKIRSGGFMTDYYIDERNYGEQDNKLSVEEIKEIIGV